MSPVVDYSHRTMIPQHPIHWSEYKVYSFIASVLDVAIVGLEVVNVFWTRPQNTFGDGQL